MKPTVLKQVFPDNLRTSSKALPDALHAPKHSYYRGREKNCGRFCFADKKNAFSDRSWFAKLQRIIQQHISDVHTGYCLYPTTNRTLFYSKWFIGNLEPAAWWKLRLQLLYYKHLKYLKSFISFRLDSLINQIKNHRQTYSKKAKHNIPNQI